MYNPDPKVPSNINPLGTEVLQKLRDNPAMGELILGGGFALQHYLPFRDTDDIDAWWSDAPSEAALDAVRDAVKSVAEAHGYGYRERKWGETFSFEMIRPQSQSKKVFSFQISTRDIPLDQPLQSAWQPFLIETLRDNVASKMNALVDRGAPRDFVDIHELVTNGLCTVRECWHLWATKNPGAEVRDAKRKTTLNLAQIEARKPLGSIEQEHRAVAAERRDFFKREFLLDRNNENDNGIGR